MFNNIIDKPMFKEQVYQIKKTTNYSLFKTIDGNRSVNSLHLNRLIKSMQHRPLISPITVNDNFEIIDGQHRLWACIELKLPVYYFIIPGYGLKEIHILNENMKNWSAEDFMLGYCDLGYSDYIMYRNFKKVHGLSHSVSLMLLTSAINAGGGALYEKFRNGTFHVYNINHSNEYANKLKRIKPFYDGWSRRSFVSAVMTLLQSDQFDFDKFIRKVERQSSKMVDCANKGQYIDVIEDIYNNHELKKVSLKYS